MKPVNSRSILLCRLLVGLFALVLAALDIGCIPLVDWFLGFAKETLPATAANAICLLTTLWVGSAAAWPCLFCLWQLLGNLMAGRVFIAANVRLLGGISLCCAAACVVCLASVWYYLPWLLVGVAAAFMGLLVLVVRSCFAQAVAMKDELDWTV